MISKESPISAPIYLSVFVCLLLCISLGTSCNNFRTAKANKIAQSNSIALPFAQRLQPLLKITDTQNTDKRLFEITYNLRLTYEENEYLPLWLFNNKPNTSVDSLLQDLNALKYDGLDPEKYGLGQILMIREKLVHDNTNIDLCIAFDTAICKGVMSNSAFCIFDITVYDSQKQTSQKNGHQKASAF